MSDDDDRFSQESQDTQNSWINWFCSQEHHQFMCEIDQEYINDKLILFALDREALKMILFKDTHQKCEEYSEKEIQTYQDAVDLYGLIHKRYILSPLGLAQMRCKYEKGQFGQCPRVYCEKQNALPIAITEDMHVSRVKVFCPRCKDIFYPKRKCADLDGCYFGTSFPHIFLLTYPDLKEFVMPSNQHFVPKIFGFKLREETISSSKPPDHLKQLMDTPVKQNKQQESLQVDDLSNIMSKNSDSLIKESQASSTQQPLSNANNKNTAQQEQDHQKLAQKNKKKKKQNKK